MKPTILQKFFALLLASAALVPVALASDGDAVSHIRFTWTVGEQPAVIALPLPDDLSIAAVEQASLPEGVRLAGIGLDSDPPRLELYPQPRQGETLDFTAVDLRLESGLRRRFEFGSASVVQLESDPGPLAFERSLAAPAAGLYQAVTLRNSGERELAVTAARYLPAQLREGQLLVAKGEPHDLLSRLEAAMSPARRREAKRAGDAYPRAQGFEWRSASDIDLGLAPGESAMLAWTDEALPATTQPTSFELRPVIEYRIESDGSTWQLGLPVTVRRRP